MLGHQVAPVEVIPTGEVCRRNGKEMSHELVSVPIGCFEITLLRLQIKRSIRVALHYVGASVPFFSGWGQKLVLQAWDMEGFRWWAQPGEGFPWTKHWTVLACTPPPHVTVHCRVQGNNTSMLDTMDCCHSGVSQMWKGNLPETKGMSAILPEAEVEGGVEAGRSDGTCSIGGPGG